MIMRRILKSVAPYILNLITIALKHEQEQAGPDQFKIFLLKSTNDMDSFKGLSSAFHRFAP